jgi:hypothetical protein
MEADAGTADAGTADGARIAAMMHAGALGYIGYMGKREAAEDGWRCAGVQVCRRAGDITWKRGGARLSLYG